MLGHQIYVCEVWSCHDEIQLILCESIPILLSLISFKNGSRTNFLTEKRHRPTSMIVTYINSESNISIKIFTANPIKKLLYISSLYISSWPYRALNWFCLFVDSGSIAISQMDRVARACENLCPRGSTHSLSCTNFISHIIIFNRQCKFCEKSSIDKNRSDIIIHHDMLKT